MDPIKREHGDEEVITAIDRDIHDFIVTSLKRFEAQERILCALVVSNAFTAMELHARLYMGTLDEENREATVRLGRKLASMLHSFFTRDRPDDAWEIVSRGDALSSLHRLNEVIDRSADDPD